MRTTLMVLLAVTALNVTAATAADSGVRASRPTKVATAQKAVHPKCNWCPVTKRCL
ncbi:hypothetical protein K8R03_01710 [Candidatus Kaiserbacteria bacterium]|nr:hypothetical protein [Candidatus Kaiserbacteria bacterium]